MKNEELFAWWFGTVVVGLAMLFGLLWLGRKRLGKWPISEKMPRPPGESLRKKLEEMEESLLRPILAMVIACLLAGGCFGTAFHFHHQSQLTAFVFLGVGVAFIGCSYLPLIKYQKEYQNYSLGFHGERVVGARLNLLMLDGCEVFHDVQIEDNWNIDHVVVSPYRVFAVETKGRRKSREPDGHKVIFTGAELQFPKGTDRACLKQAGDNARQLGQFLTKFTGEPVDVVPVLTFPGWFVERKGLGSVQVLNPAQIRQVVLDANYPRLDESQRRRICAQVELKCRDVEI